MEECGSRVLPPAASQKRNSEGNYFVEALEGCVDFVGPKMCVLLLAVHKRSLDPMFGWGCSIGSIHQKQTENANLEK